MCSAAAVAVQRQPNWHHFPFPNYRKVLEAASTYRIRNKDLFTKCSEFQERARAAYIPSRDITLL